VEVGAWQVEQAYTTEGTLSGRQPLSAHHAQSWGDEVKDTRNPVHVSLTTTFIILKQPNYYKDNLDNLGQLFFCQ
jgi:hypothetical protein